MCTRTRRYDGAWRQPSVDGQLFFLSLGDVQLNKAIQAFMYTMLADEDTTAAKRSLDVMTTLYRKRVWTDAKTVNVIATACLSKVRHQAVATGCCSVARLMVAALVFLLLSLPGSCRR